jgi:hypothetical protein
MEPTMAETTTRVVGRLVSAAQAKAFLALEQAADGWITNDELRAMIGCGRRTASETTALFVEKGLLEEVRMFPAFKYRLRKDAAKRCASYIAQLRQAAAVIELPQ